APDTNSVHNPSIGLAASSSADPRDGSTAETSANAILRHLEGRSWPHWCPSDGPPAGRRSLRPEHPFSGAEGSAGAPRQAAPFDGRKPFPNALFLLRTLGYSDSRRRCPAECRSSVVVAQPLGKG